MHLHPMFHVSLLESYASSYIILNHVVPLPLPLELVDGNHEITIHLIVPHMHLHPMFHVSLLEPYASNSIPDRVVPPPPLIELDEGVEYEFGLQSCEEQIVSFR